MATKSLKKIIQIKATVLDWEQEKEGLPLAAIMAHYVKLMNEADGMPIRGCLQRKAQQQKIQEADCYLIKAKCQLGAGLLRTYGFVQEHQKFLTPRMRRRLFGEKAE